MKTWLRSHGVPSLLLAVAYALTGRLSFLAQVDNVLVTPVFFLPEGIALAFALHFGPGIWPGIFAGQLCLALIQGLALPPSLSISAINSLEAVGAVWLYRRFGGKFDLYDLRSWMLLQGLVFLVLQPFSATFGTLTLLFAGVIRDFPSWADSWQNWWIGNGVAQSQLTPLLLLLLDRNVRVSWAKQILLPAVLTGATLAIPFFLLPDVGIGASLALFQPLLVALALRLRLKAVCVASIVISISFLYATSHGVGPFYSKADTNLLDLNVFLIGISLIGQFLAVLFQQLEERRQALVAKNLDTQLASQGAGIGFWQRDIKTGNEIWDAQMLKIYGLQPEQFDGNWEKRVHPEDLHRTNEYLTQAERDLRRFETEYRIVTPAGEVRWVKGMGSNVADAHGKPWKTYGIEYDITESRRAQAELAAAKERELTLEKEQREEITRKLKTSLAAAGIAHEINQPLSQILLQTELSLRNLAKKPGQDPENAEAFRLIQGRAEQVVGTIETIRALLGNVASDHQPLNLTDVVRSAALYLQPALQRAGVELRTEGLEATHTITGDDAQLHLLVSNLVRNAIQAVEAQPKDRRKITLTLAEAPAGLTLSVEDSGPGFTEEQKMRSELPIESTKPEGMGMGLFLARTAAENHRATITFSRSPSLGGASVTVTFPK